MDLRNYFVEAQEEINNEFFNYDGDDDYGDDYDSYDGDEDEMMDDEDYGDFDGDDDDSFDMATGGNSAPTSQPYIVNVRNSLTGSMPAVTILGSYNALANIGSTTPTASPGISPTFGNPLGTSITMGISGISYAEFLYQAMNKPFVVGLTYYQASGTLAGSQILETLTLIQKDVNGNVSQKTLVPTVDPYQQQTTVVAIKFSYKIDGFTSIVVANVLGSTTAKLYFYPAETSSVARTLTGRKVVAGYGNPNIVKSEKLQLSSRSLRALAGRRRRRSRRRRR
tara:strand:- start:12109 stop:12951 length:843 start_codon:yes stop_codon:yes gene_type:complete